MPADPETTAALSDFFTRIEGKIDASDKKSSDRSLALHTKMDSIRQDTQTEIHGLGLKVERFVSKQESHEQHDEKQFEAIDKKLDEGSKDRRGMWKAIAGGTVGGGLLAKLLGILPGGPTG